MTIEEQIELFYDAEYVVAAHGAGLSNLIFAEQAGVVELFPTPYVLPYFYFVCKSCRHDYYYWCGTESHRDSNFKVDIPAVETILETCLKSTHAFRN
jgi:capsular polysaccharide biosynthesis protein